MSQRITSQFIVRFFLGLLLIAGAASLIWYFKSLAATVALAGIAYLIIDAPTKAIEHMRVPRWQALLVVLLILHILLFGGILVLGTNVYNDLQVISQDIPNLRERFQDVIISLETIAPSSDISQYVTPERLQQVQEYFVSIISTIFSYVSTWVVNVFLIIPLLTLLLLTTGNKLKEGFLTLIPNSYFEMTVTLLEKLVKTLREYIFAKFIESVVIAVICVIGFLLIGLPGAIVLGILAGILNLIPYFGPLFSLVPPVLLAILNESPGLAIGAVVVIILAQIIDNVVLQPVLISKAVNVHPVMVVIVTFMGAELFGPLGMVIAIPIYTIGKIMVLNLYQFLASVQRRSVLEEKEQAMAEALKA